MYRAPCYQAALRQCQKLDSSAGRELEFFVPGHDEKL